MITSIKYYILLAGLIIVSCSANSQSDSLANYLEIAARNNPAVLQKHAEYQAALQKVPQVGSLPDPELSLGIFLSPMELVGGNQLADIRLMQMFPWFGVLKNAKDEMSLMAKARYETFRDAKLQVFFDVQRTWNELQKTQQSIRISEKNLEILQTIERLSLVKFKSAPSGGSFAPSNPGMASGIAQPQASNTSGMPGMGGSSAGNNSPNSSSAAGMSSAAMGSASGSGLSDLYRIQIEIGDLENQISLLRNQQQTILARFNSYLNRQLQTPVPPVEKLHPDLLETPLVNVSDSMITNNPMLKMVAFEQQSLDAKLQMVTKMGNPMVGLGLNYSLIGKNGMSASEMNGSDMIMPMVTVTLPIYRKKYKAMQEEVKLQKTATQQGLMEMGNALQTEYYEAVQLYQDALRRVVLYQNQSDLANKSLSILMKSFSATGSGMTDLLRIQQQLLDYELRHIEAITDNNTSIAWLKRLMAYSQIQ